jgi:hypothetical protein
MKGNTAHPLEEEGVSAMKPTCSPSPGRRKHVFGLAIVFSLVGCVCVPTRAADDDAPGAQARLARFQALRKERPNDGVLIFYEAIARLGLGQRETAFALLRSLKGRKLGLIPARGIGFDEVWDEPEFAAIRKELADEEPRTPDSPVAFRLNDPKLIPEGIAWDPKGERFFVGSVARRKIVVADVKGKTRDFSGLNDALDDILGLTIDSGGAHLYAVSTNGFEESAKKERRNAVVRYALKSGHLLDLFPAPEAVQLNDVAVAPDGTVYATDSASGTLFRKKPAEKTLNRFGQKGALPGANGITLAPDGTLYVTLSTGIARVDLASGQPTRLPQPDSVVTGGIDGLYWHDGDLLGIQNTPNPGRVIRIGLADKGTRVAGLTVLQSHHHPEFDEPTTGAIANGALNVIGNSYVGHYQPDGTILESGELKGTAIVAVPLRR